MLQQTPSLHNSTIEFHHAAAPQLSDSSRMTILAIASSLRAPCTLGFYHILGCVPSFILYHLTINKQACAASLPKNKQSARYLMLVMTEF